METKNLLVVADEWRSEGMEVQSKRRCLWQPWLNTDKPGEERPKATNLHRKPSSAWRKERRRDPIQSEALDMSAARVHHHHHSRPSVIVPTTPQPGTTIEDTAVTPTPSLTPSAATAGGQRTGIRTVGGVSDPAIDEHFKRSLGLEEYAAVFNATTTDKEAGLSVDDHFAKALGETWTRLQATSRSKDST
ncbi:transcription cofactor vestigial-like protein 4 isoform X1 [Osmia bicornis bicornis]|uniref:transcription cofactor vestigial-like protein 4 isoform X1 n=1 Tax=Osmia bicornis bicornis TaxID=1437191 RepID=UPI0010F72FB9|nr:transcription cofactor vestigial-like protein 4 isoform X1 [Osmia bicornis bicornis]